MTKTSLTRTIGIDPGTKGAIVAIDSPPGGEIKMHFADATFPAILRMLTTFNPESIALEHLQAFSSDSGHTAFVMGKHVGIAEAAVIHWLTLQPADLPVKLYKPKPQGWQQAIRSVLLNRTGKPPKREPKKLISQFIDETLPPELAKALKVMRQDFRDAAALAIYAGIAFNIQTDADNKELAKGNRNGNGQD